MNYNYFIGIDVSKYTLDFAVLCGKDIMFQLQTSNDLPGIHGFWKQLKTQAGFSLRQAIFCMEHTGIYNQHLLDFLFKKKASICLEASVHIKLSSGLQRGKNDRIDALRIAQYAYKNREELKLWQPKRGVIEQLRRLTTMRNRLLNARKQLTVAIKETSGFTKIVADGKLCKLSIQALSKDIDRTEQAIDEIIASDEVLKRLFAVVTSIKGIGKVTAAEMIITTNEFKDITEPSKFACYAGVAPFEHSSGIFRGKSRVSHKANKTLKSLLHMSALTAIRYNSDLKEYYQRKVEENKNKMSIVNAVRNKLIWRVFACVRDNRLYQNKYSHALA
jgi:transposase